MAARRHVGIAIGAALLSLLGCSTPGGSGGAPTSATANAPAGTPVVSADGAAQRDVSQRFLLWQEGNMAGTTNYTSNTGGYADDPSFRPFLTSYPVPAGTAVKGAVMLSSGGAFAFRNDEIEANPVARELSRLGYQAFVVDYRIRPYTAAEGALDLARAVRFVRAHADAYGVHANDIAVMGFSAGGIMSGEMLLNYDGTVTGAALDSRYRPDALDRVSADAGAAAMIYSFYGGLAVASTDVAKLAAGGLPPTYFSYGTQDPYVSQFEANIAAVRAAGVRVETNVLNGMAHGYGALGDWIPNFDTWLTAVFETK